MKKLIILAAILSVGCKKTFTCGCTTEVVGTKPLTSQFSITETQSNARTQCEARNGANSTATISCALQ